MKCSLKKSYTLTLGLLLSLSVHAESHHYRYTYDTAGNMLSAYKDQVLEKDYRYNTLNQLVGYSDVSHSYQYRYYPDGRRFSKQDATSGEAIYYYYGGNGKLLNEEDWQQSDLLYISSYFVGERFLQDQHNVNDSILRQNLSNRHNTAVSVSSQAGISHSDSIHLDDYGRQIDANQSTLDTLVIGFNFTANPYRYGSGYYDNESGLNYQGARYYDPEIQRFVAQDSYDLVNRYNYANGNPVMNYDPSGHNALSALSSAWKAMSSPGAVYGMNGAGMAMSLVGGVVAASSGGAGIIVVGAVVGVLAGGAGIAAEATPTNSDLKQKLTTAATIIGIADVAIGLVDMAGGITNLANGVRNSAVIGDVADRDYEETVTISAEKYSGKSAMKPVGFGGPGDAQRKVMFDLEMEFSEVEFNDKPPPKKVTSKPQKKVMEQLEQTSDPTEVQQFERDAPEDNVATLKAESLKQNYDYNREPTVQGVRRALIRKNTTKAGFDRAVTLLYDIY